MQPASILVVDDDPAIRSVIIFALEKAGHRTHAAGDGREAVSLFSRETPDLIVLDIGMPEMDGFAACREIRKASEVPILFLSARDEEIDRVLGLELGGDDYVTKPFSPRELVARVAAILKRSRGSGEAEARRLGRGVVSLDTHGHRTFVGEQPVALTAQEFAILRALMSWPNQVFDRERILETAWPDAIHVSDRTVDSHIRNIRAKLGAAGCATVIETVHGVGFRLGPCVAAP
ncbi:two-component system response regulator CreB [Pleomorphomonas diazotrophica]|uniref:Two-component system response regulator CreB n=1 Tax=Pleomorphomonas diazotrophica TaxID=1166257 RepID=A0A1I4VKP4_9HYPH|nr:response regulator transcription factor [Pleomorphomonas diazotrophica]PKR89650.1 two-component system response regulator CreB [Pleomorphomonas diazotrophica]SFN01700.1 two-component system, OmpR family, response regulator [Pleomorphomonas diazotrophica]